MKRTVIDASVAVKWVVDEPGSVQARELARDALIAPDLLYIECANVLWRKAVIGNLTKTAVTARLVRLSSSPVRIEPSASLLPAALEIALQLRHPVYDCLYLALARREEAPLITADERMARLTRKHPRLGIDVRVVGEPVP
jgi:predicted nucleic acid-binding protein